MIRSKVVVGHWIMINLSRSKYIYVLLAELQVTIIILIIVILIIVWTSALLKYPMILLKSTQTRILNHNQEMVMARIVIRKGNGQGIWIEMQFWKDVSWDFVLRIEELTFSYVRINHLGLLCSGAVMKSCTCRKRRVSQLRSMHGYLPFRRGNATCVCVSCVRACAIRRLKAYARLDVTCAASACGWYRNAGFRCFRKLLLTAPTVPTLEWWQRFAYGYII